jgi:hypothetical protein
VGAYDSARAFVQRVIQKKGRAVTLRRNDPGAAAVDAGKPWLGKQQVDQDAASYAVFDSAVLADMLTHLGASAETAAVEGEEAVAFVAAKDLPWEPDPGTRVVDGTRTWEVTRVGLVKPGADPILYLLGLRK